MEKSVGVDLGTNSIGLSLRDEDYSKSIIEQIEYINSIIFQSGVGKEKSGEFSFAAKRTEKRSARRLYQSRKYRIWATLKLLIENDCCPLSLADLEKWSKYDKEKGLKRQYPINATDFEQWVRLDFNGDGTADYSSPFQLRAELMNQQFNFSNQTDRYKLGRALYHIAQRRGFKSSKGETLKEQEKNEIDYNSEIDISKELQKSEAKKSGKLKEYMEKYNLPTVGCAFAHLENNGIRVRNSDYQAVRSQYKDEIKQIFEFQNGLDTNSDFYKHLVSEKKGEGTIFYKRPLRSQKGLVGFCTMEPDKSRCPISNPEFEKFRAFCLINNIRFGEELKESLSLEQKQQLYREKFLLTRTSFKFSEIKEWIQKKIGRKLEYSKTTKTINYKDNTSVSGCPISGRLKNLLGENWETWKYESTEEKANKKTGEIRHITYTTNDLWHVCFSFDEPEYIEEFAKNKLHFDDDKTKQLVRIYGSIQQGYGMLSLKAIRNINRFLEKGLMYTDAVLLAKLPDIFKEKWNDVEANIISSIDNIISENRKQKQLYFIVNSLIANYKSLDVTDQFAYKNYYYKLVASDIKDIKTTTINVIGAKTWENKTINEQNELLNNVADLYQKFFSSEERDYYKLPKVSDALAEFIGNEYQFISASELKKIYHPSMIEFYAPAKLEKVDGDRYIKLLGSPVIGALKNPMALRVLHILRKQINDMLKASMIDENTRIVVETARELNDANMRKAIEAYQREREAENKEYEKIIKEFYSGRDIKDSDLDQVRLLCEQHDISENITATKQKENIKVPTYKKDITKYRLWAEQGCRCIYTGKIINITNLFDDNAYDIEHTIPRSISFDDSLANLTVCDAHYNRTIKKNQIPAQLPNYEEIKLRIQPWVEKVEKLKENVEYWKAQSKRAQTKERKDHCIQQRHLWQMELDYWQNKVDRFTMTEVTSGFRNNQLNDTRIITKYAYHYLKTVFNKVEVQKGSATSNFRKMLGIQSLDEKKSRDKHSHHAIDATVLTLIPTAAQREKMLELFFKIQEKKHLNENTETLERELEAEKRRCGLSGNISKIVPFIEENILVNHVNKDQKLSSAHRRKRIRGKIVPLKDSEGNVIYELNDDGTIKKDKHGHPIPQAKEWITGDCIRGQLHGETFYGAITQGLKDENGKLIRNDDGSIKTSEEILYVVRRELKHKANDNDSGFKNWEELEKAIVDKDLFKIIKNQFKENTSLKEACASGIYMYKKNKNGEIDFSEECKVNKIRHIRCLTSIKKPLEIKEQTYMSTKPYKRKYYAEMGDLYVMCKYESNDKKEKEYHIFSLFDVSVNRKTGIEDIPTCIESKKRTKLILTQQLKRGDMLLIYKNTIEELKESDNTDMSQHLYVIRGFENDGNRIILQKSINALPDKDLGKGESIKDYSNMPEKIRCGINTLKYLIKDKDFYLTPKGIIFK